MAHSFIQAHEDETAAFERFAVTHPDNVVLLIDTYDTEAAAEKVVGLAKALALSSLPAPLRGVEAGPATAPPLVVSPRIEALFGLGSRSQS